MSSSRFPLLRREEERDTEVTWQDQQRINEFSKLNARYERLDDEYKRQKEEDGYLDDLAMDIELLDDDEPVRYKIGDVFIKMALEDAQARVQEDKARISRRVSDLDAELGATQAKMDALKKTLYAKFGQAINLEKS
ncbi:hypothetical protein H4R21_004897 [Coemansia helicoidea]|uniref:Uncharacterized protein n=1 Tax=Coemansia helicoidea TaxID=1286919 RepID=A0ACC1KWE7_9FUNG|nr:hypothetical protein H4R21_004897 [Coemansia helicoidea]